MSIARHLSKLNGVLFSSNGHECSGTGPFLFNRHLLQTYMQASLLHLMLQIQLTTVLCLAHVCFKLCIIANATNP